MQNCEVRDDIQLTFSVGLSIDRTLTSSCSSCRDNGLETHLKNKIEESAGLPAISSHTQKITNGMSLSLLYLSTRARFKGYLH